MSRMHAVRSSSSPHHSFSISGSLGDPRTHHAQVEGPRRLHRRHRRIAPHGRTRLAVRERDAFPGAEVDPLYGAKHIKDLYLRAAPNYEGRFSVPVLWDKKTHTVVNNESSEIIRIFNSAFNHLLPADKAKLDYYPEHLRKEIDEVNEWVYDTVNSAYFPPDASLA